MVLPIIANFDKVRQRFKYCSQEQGYLACMAEEGDGLVSVNKAGSKSTLAVIPAKLGSLPSVASTAWGRISAALMRLTHYVLGRLLIEMLLYADDFEILAPGPQGRKKQRRWPCQRMGRPLHGCERGAWASQRRGLVD